MGWSTSIGRIAGTTIRVHITFWLFLGWIFFATWESGGAAAATYAVAFMVLLFACVVAHEFGHIFMARHFGVATPTVTLLPIGGVAQLERIPEKPREEFLVAIAGPLVNVVIAAILIGVFGARLDTANLVGIDNPTVSMVDRLAIVNLFLVAFNIIPAFPMDGGRVLRAALASRMGYVRATEVAATIGQWVAFGLGFFGLFHNALLLFIAVFVYLAAASESHMVAARAMAKGVPVTAGMMTRLTTLTPDSHIDEAVQAMLQTSQSEFPVIDAHDKPVGLLGRNELIGALKELGPNARVGDTMNPDVQSIDQRRCLDEAFQLLQQKQAPAVAIVDNDGRLVGLVTSETIGEMIMLHNAMPRGYHIGPRGRPVGA